MAERRGTARKMRRFVERIHYVQAAEESRRGAVKRAIGAAQLRWDDNIHGRNAYIVDSVTGFNSKNLAMFIREIPAGGATGSHYHNFEAVAYVLDGRGHDVHDGKAVRWRTGDGLYIPPMVVHRHVNDDPARPATLLFIANWPLLNHLGITQFVQLSEAPRRARRPATRRRVRRFSGNSPARRAAR